MKYLIIKDIKKRKNYNKLEMKIFYLKSLVNITNLDKDLREKLYFKLQKYQKKISSIRLKNRCVVTYRSKSIYRDVKISRIFFRQTASDGLINGVRKSSW